MSDAAEPRITCPVCGTQYRWMEDLAGYKIKCKCSAVLRMPVKPTTAPSVLEDGHSAGPKAPGEQYDIDVARDDSARTEEVTTPTTLRTGKCPSCGLAIKYGTVVCMNCGFNIAEGTKIKTSVAALDAAALAAEAAEQERVGAAINAKFSHLATKVARTKEREERDRLDAARQHRRREFTIPVLFLVFGLLSVLGGGMMLASSFEKSPLAGLAIAGALIVVEIGFMVPLLLLAVYMAASIGGIGFGSLYSAILKLGAICCGPGAIGDVIMLFVALLFGFSIYVMVAAVTVVYTLCLGLPMMYLFDLDAQDMRLTVGLAVVVRIFAAILAYALLAGLFT